MKNFALFASLLISLTFPFPVQSQSPSFSNEVDKLLESTFSQADPGIAVVITKRGETIYMGAFGSANLELQKALNVEMPFEIASITKQITSAAILMLEDQGKLSISDTLSKYFPDHPSPNATLEQLMQNISGIFVPDHSMGSNHVREDLSREDRYELIVSGAPYFEPGERYAYSNSGYWLLGDIIEQVSGLPYGEFVSQYIFEPLGMANSHYGSHREIIPNRVSGYDYTDEGIVNASYTSETWSYSAGGLISSAVDIAKWNNALFAGRVIPISSVEKMTTPAILNSGETIPYGYGLALGEFNGSGTAGHGGGHSGFLIHSERLIDEEIFVVVLANSFYVTNGYRPPDPKNPALIARRLAQMAMDEL
jgi:CubicO group peptidase (beta-lactamase class C family)